jgi:hypothetical protein
LTHTQAADLRRTAKHRSGESTRKLHSNGSRTRLPLCRNSDAPRRRRAHWRP